jgi:LPS-assembly protein
VSPFVQARSSAYDISDLPGVEENMQRRQHQRRGRGRLRPADGAPSVQRRPGGGAPGPGGDLAREQGRRHRVNADGSPIYFNEDGVSFEFEETNLLRPNKFPGFDLYEGGKRVNVAGRAPPT